MKILEGTVIDLVDISHQGLMGVHVPALCISPDEMIPVHYVSPYGGDSEAGMIMIPEIHQKILIVQPDSSGDWYYLGSIYDQRKPSDPGYQPLKKAEKGTFDPLDTLPDKRIYNARSYPQRLVIQDPKNNALILSHRTSPDIMDIKAKLRSSKGKELILDDSKGIEAVTLKNEHGDGLTITGEKNPALARRTTKIENMEGPQYYICRQSSMDFWVYDGKDIGIVNNSTGSNAPSGESPIPEQYGNINIESDKRDIYLTAGDGEQTAEGDGRIMLKCKGRFQVNSEGEGVVQVVKGLNIEVTKGDFHLKVDGDINLDAGGNVNINASNKINMNANAELNAVGTNAVNMDGAMMYLNSGKATGGAAIAAKATDTADCINNHYDTGGE